MSTGSGDEVAELRERVRLLSAGLGVEEGFEVSPDVRRHAGAGRGVQAVQELRRQAPELSLLAAKRMVDALQR